MSTGILNRGWVHMAVGCVAMGSWAAYANAAHPMPKPAIAGMLQGVLSGGITFALKSALDRLRAKTACRVGWWLPPLIACILSLAMLLVAHLLAGTPEVLRTIVLPFSVATLYAVTYNFIMWKKGSDHD